VVQRREDPARREQAGDDVDERHADLLWVALGLAGDAHQPADRLHEQVVARERAAGAAAEPREGAVHEPRVRGGELLVAESRALHHAGAEVLDHDVRSLGERAGSAARLWLGEVEDEALLVPVDREEVRRRPRRVVRRTPAPRLVAGLRALDLRHPGAEVAEQHRRERPREDAREVDDVDPLQRTCHWRETL
jgi:hypothetical protein